jgi:hypothetical protein
VDAPCAWSAAGYIGEFEFVDNHRSGKIVVELNGRLNKCGVISPRYDISAHEIEAWVGRLLPSRQFGYFIMTTSQGIMDHEEARCAPLEGQGGVCVWGGGGGGCERSSIDLRVAVMYIFKGSIEGGVGVGGEYVNLPRIRKSAAHGIAHCIHVLSNLTPQLGLQAKEDWRQGAGLLLLRRGSSMDSEG